MSKRTRYLAAGAGIATAILIFVWLMTPPGALRQGAGFMLAWILPAITWTLWWNGALSERIVIGASTALMLNALLALLVSYVPGDTPAWALLLCVLVTGMAPLVHMLFEIRPDGVTAAPKRSHCYPLLALMIVALLLRLPGMGYKEFQGDEGVVMVRAAAILTGNDSEWFNHQKGPMEILLPLVGWGLTGSINDYWARLPFTWAGTLAVLAVYWLGRRWFDAGAGLVAGLLFAVGGFGIAFSRVVQYQSLVMLWSAMALLMATRYKEDGKTSDLVMASSFLAAGLLAHYDAILVAPAVAWLFFERLRADGRLSVAPLLSALAAGGFILALFYIPYLLDPNFARTFNYLVRDRVGLGGGGVVVAGGIGDGWRMMTFYNSIWYVLGLTAGAALGVIVALRRRTGLAAVLYFAVPAVFYLVLVQDPRTHIYTILPGAAVLAGVGMVVAWRGIQHRARSVIPQIAVIVGVLWLFVVVLYPILLFVDTSVERQRTWADNRPLPALYPTTWDEPPEYGLFGFPHQAGWRAVASLGSDIALPYGSNEEEQIADWYMAQAQRTYCNDANTFMLAANAQDEVPYDAGWLERELALWGEVTVAGESSMMIYARDKQRPTMKVEATSYDHWLTPAEARGSQQAWQREAGATFGKEIRLLGYDLDGQVVQPGQAAIVTLYWQALESVPRNYQVFVHLYDGELWAQHDGAPGCNVWPTTRWEPGQIISDPHIIELPAEIPPGPMPLVVGLYDLLTEERLPLAGDKDGALHLTDIVIEAG